MSIDLNEVFFGGRLTDDPTTIGNSNQGCKFDVASNRTYKKDGERVEDTTFMPITVWGTLSELVMQRCRKGSQVLVKGRIEVRKFDAEDGSPRKFVNIVATDVRFVDARPADAEDAPKQDSMPFPAGTQLPPGVTPESAMALMKMLQAQNG